MTVSLTSLAHGTASRNAGGTSQQEDPNNAEAFGQKPDGFIPNIASGQGASVSGGAGSQSSGDFSVVAGGSGNAASSYGAVLGGGVGNVARGTSSTVGGGSRNIVGGVASVIAGGLENSISDGSAYAAIGGGFANRVDHPKSVIPGGYGAKTRCARSAIFSGGPFSSNNSDEIGSNQLGTYHLFAAAADWAEGEAVTLSPLIVLDKRGLLRFKGAIQVLNENGDFAVHEFSGTAYQYVGADGDVGAAARSVTLDAPANVVAATGVVQNGTVTASIGMASGDSALQFTVASSSMIPGRTRVSGRIDTVECNFAFYAQPADNHYETPAIHAGYSDVSVSGVASVTVEVGDTMGCKPETNANLLDGYSALLGTDPAFRWTRINVVGPAHIVATTDSTANPDSDPELTGAMDSMMAVFAGLDPDTAVFLGANDDDQNAAPAADGTLSTVAFDVQQGAGEVTALCIGISGYGGASVPRPFSLTVTATPL